MNIVTGKSLLFCVSIFCGGLNMVACKSARQHSTPTTAPVQAVNAPSSNPDAARTSVLNVQKLPFHYLSTKLKIRYEDEASSFSATASIRAAQDSLLWVSVQKLGIEFLRCRFTPDSALIADHYNHTFYTWGYAALSKELGVTVSYDLLQALVVGNLPQPHTQSDSIANDSTVFQPVNDDVFWKNIIANTRPKHLLLSDTARKSELSVALSSWQTTPQNVNFALQKNIHLQYQTQSLDTDHTYLQLEHTRLEWPSQCPEFPFKAYPNYKQVKSF
ncbi:protein of unknown function [Flexibacter flexilis DSM 6793]|uniref:DUF4292 domain-containing protein n=2 Tax=Flexibacter flexilis TaxID=998 RepID=A0A1I1E9Q7_9BACT|nr:protein of unknown function [Flexibacter flexilis DSM 6793]